MWTRDVSCLWKSSKYIYVTLMLISNTLALHLGIEKVRRARIDLPSPVQRSAAILVVWWTWRGPTVPLLRASVCRPSAAARHSAPDWYSAAGITARACRSYTTWADPPPPPPRQLGGGGLRQLPRSCAERRAAAVSTPFRDRQSADVPGMLGRAGRHCDAGHALEAVRALTAIRTTLGSAAVADG